MSGIYARGPAPQMEVVILDVHKVGVESDVARPPIRPLLDAAVVRVSRRMKLLVDRTGISPDNAVPYRPFTMTTSTPLAQCARGRVSINGVVLYGPVAGVQSTTFGRGVGKNDVAHDHPATMRDSATTSSPLVCRDPVALDCAMAGVESPTERA